MSENELLEIDTKSPIFFFGTLGDYGFLSNFFFRMMAVSNGDPKNVLRFPTVEHFMHYQKAVLFGDAKRAKAILATPTPNKAKKIGGKVEGFNEELWAKQRRKIVLNGLAFKFSYPDLAKKLIATGDRELVEASPYDRIWGIGFSEEKAMANRKDWGENLLGKCLMAIRSNLINEGEPGPVEPE
jgi:ribA/ribD-fused uncharacterized protein